LLLPIDPPMVPTEDEKELEELLLLLLLVVVLLLLLLLLLPLVYGLYLGGDVTLPDCHRSVPTDSLPTASRATAASLIASGDA